MPISSDERFAYVTLALVPGIGPARLERLKQACGTWTGALAAPVAFLGSIPGISGAAAQAIGAAKPARTERLIRRVATEGDVLLTPFDPDYPERLLPIADPPALLFARGRLELARRPTVAIVGSRHPTSYGITVTREVARHAAIAGLTVVSGMARGLDAVAHWEAVRSGGTTIGVLGNGLGIVYPAANATLYDRVASEGLLLTEHPPGERPNAGSFQRRNRLIAGLARVTVVTEAAFDSGAMKTANYAVDQGSDVVAVPGPIVSKTSAGTNLLIRDGAGPYLEPEDLLSRFKEVTAAVRKAARAASPADLIRSRLRDDLRRVFDALDGVARTPEALAAELRLPAPTVFQALAELAITGVAEEEPGGFRRAH